MAQSGRETFGLDSLEDWDYMCSGGFGLIYKAKHKDLGINVVIKLLDTDDGSGKLYAALCREAAYMEAAENQYVPRVYGMYRGPVHGLGPKKRRGIVMELMEGGSLQSFQQTLSKTPPWPLAFHLAHQVALAMDFLQSKRDLVHMDLKPANILLDANFNAKIADFGLSTVSNSVKSTKGVNQGGTVAYTPPEAFGDEYHRVRSYDVYSYGILLWTILTGESPYPGVDQSLLRSMIKKGDRPDLRKIDVQKAAGLGDLVDLMKRCWHPEPNERPSFGECVEVTRGVFSIHEEGIHAAVSDTSIQLKLSKCPWKKCKTDTGETFYQNSQTKETTWTKPKELKDLEDYLKNLPPDSVDYKDTQAALGIVKEVANHANDIIKQGDNFQKMIQVQCRLNGHHEIVQPGRVFLKEGVLMKLSRKVMQPRTFFLFNDTLLYATPGQSGHNKLNNMLSLAGMKVSKPNQEAYQNELNIESVERSFILSASSATERDEWLEAISMAINDYTRKKITFISGKAPEEIEPSDSASLGCKAPIWIPDLRATMCMICTCEFSLTWRRHHCRACGKVVCQACSSNKCYLEYLKNQLARVCDQCFTILQLKKSEQAQAMALSPGSKSAFAFTRKQKKIPAALKEVTANTDNSSMSGYLQRSKANKRQVKRLWFVIKDKVLYTYAASEDVAALESQPLLGFMLKEDSSQKLQFKLYHKNTLYYIFKADDIQTAQRWIDSFKEATVL